MAGDTAHTRALAALGSDATTAEVLALVDALPPVRVEELTGAWRGVGLPSGHPLDGVLERLGWHGKRFAGPEDAHPLVFRGPGGSLLALDPARLPVALLARYPRLGHLPGAGLLLRAATPFLATRRPRARLRVVEHRGVPTAAMVYDAVPVVDAFRRVDERTLVGQMDLRGLRRPYFFVLRREGAGRVRPGT